MKLNPSESKQKATLEFISRL